MLEPNIDINATLDPSCQVWGNATVRAGASIGARTIIGTGVYIDSGVVVGSDCKIQNSAQVYFPAKIENGVFIDLLLGHVLSPRRLLQHVGHVVDDSCLTDRERRPIFAFMTSCH